MISVILSILKIIGIVVSGLGAIVATLPDNPSPNEDIRTRISGGFSRLLENHVSKRTGLRWAILGLLAAFLSQAVESIQVIRDQKSNAQTMENIQRLLTGFSEIRLDLVLRMSPSNEYYSAISREYLALQDCAQRSPSNAVLTRAEISMVDPPFIAPSWCFVPVTPLAAECVAAPEFGLTNLSQLISGLQHSYYEFGISKNPLKTYRESIGYGAFLPRLPLMIIKGDLGERAFFADMELTIAQLKLSRSQWYTDWTITSGADLQNAHFYLALPPPYPEFIGTSIGDFDPVKVTLYADGTPFYSTAIRLIPRDGGGRIFEVTFTDNPLGWTGEDGTE